MPDSMQEGKVNKTFSPHTLTEEVKNPIIYIR